MIDALGAAVMAGLGDPELVFVFPSEVAARRRMEWALGASGRRASPLDRFVSWDAFKSIAFPGPEGAEPISSALRAVFARALMARNAAEPFLEELVPAEASAASPRFARAVAKALPALGALEGLKSRGRLVRDWRSVAERYAAFLAERGLYEPGWNRRVAVALRRRYLLLCPELTTDWQEYEPGLAWAPWDGGRDYADGARPAAGSVYVLSEADLAREARLAREGIRAAAGRAGAGEADERVPAVAYETSVDEVRAALLRIREAVAAGVDPADIIISLAAPDSILPLLEREARVLGVELDRREGRPLAQSAAGRLFADLVAVARSDFSFEAARTLLLDRSRPWKASVAPEALVDLAIRKHILASVPGVDIWEASMGPRDKDERGLYRALKRSAAAVASARGFRALREAFDAFRFAFLDDGAWSPAQDDELARVIRELDELIEAEEAAGLGPDPNAASTFLGRLAETRYLPAGGGEGISVYRFPVAAGAMPALHLALNLSEAAAQVASRPLSFLRDDEREALGARDRDISDGLVRLLSISGRETVLSYAERGTDGVRPPHPALRPASADAPAAEWLPKADLDRPGPLAFPAQRRAARAALKTVFRGPGPDWSEARPDAPAALEAEAAGRAAERLRRDGVLGVSNKLLEELARCPFKRLFERHLKVEAQETGLSFVDGLMIGRLYHRCFELLFAPMAERGVAVSAGSEAGERPLPDPAALPVALDRAIAEAGLEDGAFAAVVHRASRGPYLRDLGRALDALRPALDGLVPYLVEVQTRDARFEIDGKALAYTGRMDLVCVEREAAAGSGPAADRDGGIPPGGSRPRRACIVDYKKRGLPSLAELRLGEDGELGRFQIPGYALLCREAGLDPRAAYYLSVEGNGADRKKRLVVAIGDDPKEAAMTPDGLGPALDALKRAAARAAEAVERGLVYLPSEADQETACDGCGLRPVCRVRYATR